MRVQRSPLCHNHFKNKLSCFMSYVILRFCFFFNKTEYLLLKSSICFINLSSLSWGFEVSSFSSLFCRILFFVSASFLFSSTASRNFPNVLPIALNFCRINHVKGSLFPSLVNRLTFEWSGFEKVNLTNNKTNKAETFMSTNNTTLKAIIFY